CGPQINPMIVDGQVHGGVIQGLGEALQEMVVYDEDGQLLTGTMMDYAVPKASQMPKIETAHTVAPSPVNPLGVKGVGETGTIASVPTVVNAVCDALAPLGVTHIDKPSRRPACGPRSGRRREASDDSGSLRLRARQQRRRGAQGGRQGLEVHRRGAQPAA